jgi:hypothetical protein
MVQVQHILTDFVYKGVPVVQPILLPKVIDYILVQELVETNPT